MQADLKTTSRDIRISNEGSPTQIKFDKLQLITALRNITAVLLFLALGTLLIRTYVSESPHFWPLLKATGILTMVTFIAFLSNNKKKQIRHQK